MRDFESQTVKLKHRNQLLPLYRSENAVTVGANRKAKRKQNKEPIIELAANKHDKTSEETTDTENTNFGVEIVAHYSSQSDNELRDFCHCHFCHYTMLKLIILMKTVTKNSYHQLPVIVMPVTIPLNQNRN